MGFIPEPHEVFIEADEQTSPIASRSNVEGASATRIRLDGPEPVYGHEVPIEFGFWPRELPADLLLPGWGHRWLRLECRYEPPDLRRSRERRPTEADLLRHEESVRRMQAESKGRSTPTASLADALRKLASIQRALARLDDAEPASMEACRVSRARTESLHAPVELSKPPERVVKDEQLARSLLARCLVERGEVLHALGRNHQARDVLREANDLFRTVLRQRPRQEAGLMQSLHCLEAVLEELGPDHVHEHETVLTEVEQRGSLRPKHDTLIVAEVPFAGRRRCDLAVFRRGLGRAKPYLGRRLRGVVEARVAERIKAVRGVEDAALRVNVAQIVLEAMEDPAIVARDPFNTDARVFIAGISSPNSPFWEPDRDFTPNWNDDDAARTGWTLGVCADAPAAHAQVLDAIEGMVQLAEDGELYLFPPSGSSGPIVRPPGDRIGRAARCMATWAVWQAMAGTKKPVRVGMPVAAIARLRLNDLLYNVERRAFRAPSPACGLSSTTLVVDTEDSPSSVIEHRRKVERMLDAHVGEPWARAGRQLLKRCAARTAPEHELIAIQQGRLAYQRAHPAINRVEEVADFVEQWLRSAIKVRCGG
ncbi:MAG: hypothetical protein AAGF11_52415 [Myxococcota bacterium]